MTGYVWSQGTENQCNLSNVTIQGCSMQPAPVAGTRPHLRADAEECNVIHHAQPPQQHWAVARLRK